MTPDQVQRYLHLLGVPPAPPSSEALRALVRAHVERVPFENVSKLYRLRRSGLRGVPDVDAFLDGVEHLRLGGTCYANATHLHALLEALGYRASLRGADMSRPDVHVVVVVDLDGRELLVDPGYGAPFLAPMPLDLDRDLVVALGRDRWVLRRRDPGGRSALELERDGVRRHGYVVGPTPRDPGHFRGAIADSFRPDATFMNAITIARFSGDGALHLRNLSLVEVRRDRETRTALVDRGELVRVAETVLGVPRDVTEEALEAVKDLATDPWA